MRFGVFMGYIQVRVDDALKSQAALVADSLGVDLPTAIRMFLKQMVKDNAMPFRPVADPFYSEENQTYLKKLLEDYRSGRVKPQEHALIRP